MSSFSRLREAGLRTLRRAGWAGWAGLGLLGAAVVVDVASEAVTTERRAALAVQRTQLAQGAAMSGGAVGGLRSAASVADFHAGFPQARSLPRTLARIYEFADNHGLNVDRTAYRSVDEPGTPLARVSLQLPAQGGYGALYAWLGEMLGAMPEVGLESLVIRRVEPGADLVEADVRLVVFVRRGS